MLTTRMAGAGDAETIAGHRVRMFVDSGQAESEALTLMARNFVEWARPRLEDGRYLGWLVEEEGAVVAGAGMWLMDFPPHWMDAEPVRAYLLNFYVEPAYRGRGMAEHMLKTVVDEAKRRRIGVVSLHASKMGRPLYEQNGFVGTNEMMLRER